MSRLYPIFKNVIKQYRMPDHLAGVVIYSYWITDESWYGRIDVERLKRDIESGKILIKRGIGKKKAAQISKALSEYLHQ